ncbi:esterase [Opitutus sp. ER46]|uniref:alpha/beta hydrolase n=1 Tax=Opitutus sp. ER46 TaxID=2161864 RepID=UPI000D30D262|nr:esterase [Opitutus sp. ER46]PTX91422.1 esterase [Opitutus sp. ER46]
MKFSFALLLGLTALGTMSSLPADVITSPVINADRSITFRHVAPNAKEVMLRCEALPAAQPLTRDAEGTWTLTTPPVAPDIYVYSLMVDGQRVLDPLNPFIKYNLFGTENQVEVPGDNAWTIREVPHGVLHRHHYRSAVIGEERDVWVYTPPGYDAAASRTYPVLYLLHGYSDAEDAWVTVGRANIIVDNLIARGAAQPMLIVMPRGYGNRDVVAGGWNTVRSAAGRDIWMESNQKYGESLVREIIPLVERSYRVKTDRESRAIAGLSMGGTQSLLFGLGAPQRFAWVGAFSAGGMPTDFEARFPDADEKLDMRLLWMACGTEDGLIVPNRTFVAWLKERKVKHTWVETPGKHSFRVWRPYLADFLPQLFQAPPPTR